MVDGWSLGQVLAWWFLSQDYGPGFCSLHFIFGLSTLDGWRLGQGLAGWFLSQDFGTDGRPDTGWF